MNTTHYSVPTVPVSRKEMDAGGKRLYLTESQRFAILQLNNLGDVFLRGANVSYGGIAVRCKALVLGGTGSGKTSVARRFAASRGWNFLSLDSSGWVPIGAAAKPATLQVLRDHVRRLPAGAQTPTGQVRPSAMGVILLDEIDKLAASVSAVRDSSYTTAQLSEMLAFLDSDERLLGHGWTRQDIEKLKVSFYVIGAGSFQIYAREAERKMRGSALGFGAGDKTPQNLGQCLSDMGILPDEIASRFAAPPIFISPPTRDDFATAIKNIHQDLGLEMARPLEELLNEATAHIGGVRWLETYVTKVLIANPIPPKPQESNVSARSADKAPDLERTMDFFATDVVEHVRQLNADVFSLRVALAQVVSGLHLSTVQDRLVKTPENAFWSYLNANGSFWQHTCNTIDSCNLCAEASSHLSHIEPLVVWEERAWKGIRDHSSDLEALGLLSAWMKGWDLCNRVVQRQSYLSAQVARGTYQG